MIVVGRKNKKKKKEKERNKVYPRACTREIRAQALAGREGREEEEEGSGTDFCGQLERWTAGVR